MFRLLPFLLWRRRVAAVTSTALPLSTVRVPRMRAMCPVPMMLMLLAVSALFLVADL